MDKNISWHNEITGKNVVQALKDNNFSAFYAESKGEAIAHLLEEIKKNDTIGIGGSATVVELGLESVLEEMGHTIYNHNKVGIGKEESLAIRRKELFADVFISSANAITLNGEIVNTDGSGNRVAAMIFGPKKVIIIAGINKIVTDIESAKMRIKQIAAPINAKRLNRKTPCVTTGTCMNCSSPERICAVTTVMHKKPLSTDVHVVIVGESLGY